MANPDDPRVDDVVTNVMDDSCSSSDELEEMETEDIILHNQSASEFGESDDDFEPLILRTFSLTSAQAATSPSPSPVQQPAKRQRHLSEDEWVDVTDYDPGPTHKIPIYNVNAGPCLPTHFDETTEPIEYFSLFFNEDLITHICNETNLFANQKKQNTQTPHSRLNTWVDVGVIDMKAFLGTIIAMGLMPLSNIQSYYSTKWERRIPFFGQVMGRNHFLNLFYNLHFNHDTDGNRHKPKGFLIQPVLDHIRDLCQVFFTPGHQVAVDESTFSYNGKISFRLFKKNKPTKFGLKVFVLSDCTNGYMYNFMPYFGKQEVIPNSSLLKTTQIVKYLAESVILKDAANPTKGLHVYTDRFYTSPELAAELLERNIFLTGTVLTNRSGLPDKLKASQRKMKRGDIRSQRKGDTLVVSWRDKRVVTMLSSNNKGSKQHMKYVASKGPNQPVMKPDIVLDYTQHMGAVDRSEHFISSYKFLRKARKSYRKMFFWLLEVSIINSYLLYKNVQEAKGKIPTTHFEFRYSLVNSLVKEKVAQPQPNKKMGRQPQGPPEQRLDGKQHFLGRRPRGTRCVVCYKHGIRRESIYFCKTCSNTPNLHPEDCFEAYHTKRDF